MLEDATDFFPACVRILADSPISQFAKEVDESVPLEVRLQAVRIIDLHGINSKLNAANIYKWRTEIGIAYLNVPSKNLHHIA